MSLMKAELRRLLKRWVTRWMVIGALAILGLVAAGIAATNQQVGPDTRAEAEAQAQRDYEEQRRWWDESVDQELAACEEWHDAGRPDNQWWPDDCQEILTWAPQPEHFDPQWYMPPTFEFSEGFQDMIFVFAAVLSLLAFVVGASFVGAEWRTGGMMNLLLWRPRRLQVLGAKLGTLLLGLLGLGVVVGVGWAGLMWLIAVFRGLTDTTTAEVWQSFALTGLRGLALILAAGAIGFALASIGRHAAMAMGAAIVAVVGLVGTIITVGVLGFRYPEAYLWSTYVQAWMAQVVVVYDWNSCDFVLGSCEPATLEITWQVAGLGILAAVVLLVGAAAWHMRSRDVT